MAWIVTIIIHDERVSTFSNYSSNPLIYLCVRISLYVFVKVIFASANNCKLSMTSRFEISAPSFVANDFPVRYKKRRENVTSVRCRPRLHRNPLYPGGNSAVTARQRKEDSWMGLTAGFGILPTSSSKRAESVLFAWPLAKDDKERRRENSGRVRPRNVRLAGPDDLSHGARRREGVRWTRRTSFRKYNGSLQGFATSAFPRSFSRNGQIRGPFLPLSPLLFLSLPFSFSFFFCTWRTWLRSSSRWLRRRGITVSINVRLYVNNSRVKAHLCVLRRHVSLVGQKNFDHERTTKCVTRLSF